MRQADRSRLRTLCGVFLLLCLTPSGRAAGDNPTVTAADVLTFREGKFHLEGKPFAEISFNKFDLLWNVYRGMADARKKGRADAAKEALATQDGVLRELHEMGFRTIRFFGVPPRSASEAYDDPQLKALWLRALDMLLDSCERHDMKVIFSLGAAEFHDPAPPKNGLAPPGRESSEDLIAKANSRSRRRLYRYLDEFVARYKMRKSVAMWEITNELTNSADIGQWKGEPMPTLAQVAAFCDDVAKRIKSNDPLRLVSNGGSHVREYAWGLHQGRGWKQRDTIDEHLQAFSLLFGRSAVDVIDIHYYAVRQGGYKIIERDNQPLFLTLERYRDIGERLGKGSIFGEYGPLPSGWLNGGKKPAADPEWFEGYNDPLAKKWVQKAVDDIVEAGAPLVYFWCYHSDRPQDQKPNPITISREKTPEIVKIIVDGNRRLKAKL